MTATRLICPECNATLKPATPVPDGKRVKCPKCGAGFAAPGIIAQTVFEVVEEDQPPPPRPQARPPATKGKGKQPAAKGARPPARPRPDEEEEGGTYAVSDPLDDSDKPDIAYVPDVGIKDLRGPAMGHLVRPSNFLMFTAALSCVTCIFAMIFQAWPFLFAEHVINHYDYFWIKYDKSTDPQLKVRKMSVPQDRKGLTTPEMEELTKEESKQIRNRTILIILFLVLMIYDGIIALGAVRMQNMESRGWSLAAAIMTIIPIAGGGILFILYLVWPFVLGALFDDESVVYYVTYGIMGVMALLISAIGVWCLRVLLLEEVIEGFNYVAD
jgi:hypothetical protein